MTDRELMQQALDAMLNNPDDISDEMFESIKALKERLAQAKQEPVAWMYDCGNGGRMYAEELDNVPGWIPLYTAPHQWQGLTDDEIEEAGHLRMLPYSFARAIEAKLKEKNNGQ